MAKETISQTEGLCKEVANCIRNAYDRGYKQGAKDAEGEARKKAYWEQGYNEGMKDAWELVRKLRHPSYGNTYSDNEKKDIFGYVSADSILTNLSASEAIQKVKEYEEKQKQDDDEIKVGDEVIFPNGKKGIVWLIYGNECHTIGDYNRVRPKEYLKRTGRHFDQIAEVLEQMKGE